jgi:hypothetical protein
MRLAGEFPALKQQEVPMIRVGKISVCLIALFVLSACDDGQALTESQARQALQDYYDAHPICTTMAIGFPVEIDNVSYLKGSMEALTKAGLIVVTGTRYRVTTAGESVLHPGAYKFLGGTDICFAKRSVQKITVMTVSAEVAGAMIATVTYDHTLKDIAPWTNEPTMASAFPQIGTVLGKSQGHATDVLVKTTDGWRHEREVR